MTKTTVLIVEDEAIVAADLASKLGQLGYEVIGTEARGEDAVESAYRLKPEVVLMDIRLKGAMDGIEAAEAILRRHNAPVIYLTAHSDEATLVRAKLSQPFGYILKPFEERELLTIIEMALSKHQSEMQLREQREWLRITLTSIGDAVISCDNDGLINFLNPVAEALTGWSSTEARMRPIGEVLGLINELTRQPCEDSVAQVLREGCPKILANHTALVTREGLEIPIEDSAAPILDADGRVIGVVLVFRDVTEKRRAEEVQGRLAAIVESAGDAIIGKDLNGIIETWNVGAEKIFGYQAQEVIGKPVSLLVPPGHSNEVPEILRRISQGDHVDNFETVRMRKDGTFVPVALKFSAIKDANGRIVGASKIARDISERKRTEEALRQSEEKYRTLFDSLLEGFCIIEVLFDAAGCPIDYRFLEHNPSFAAQTGLLEAQGNLITELAPGHDKHWFEIYGKVALTGEPARFVNEAKALNRWYDVSAYRVGGAEGRKVAILFNDISEARHAEEALRDSEARLRAANKNLLLANDDLQSANGELQVQGEELQTQREMLRAQNQELARLWEISAHAEETLKELNDDLERRVAERTEELAATIDNLREEIIERGRAEKRAWSLNRLYAVLTEINQTIIRTKDRHTLFRDFCQIAVAHGGFKLAWVGLVDEESREIKSIAAEGVTRYLEGINISTNEESTGLGPTGISVRNGTYFICNDFLGSPITRPWHERARIHGIRASASIALKQQGRVIGALTLYADKKDFFDQQQVALLCQIGADVSFALDNLAQESARQAAERALQEETAERLHTLESLREKEKMLIQQSRQAALGEMIGNIAHQWRQPLNTLGLAVQSIKMMHDLGECTTDFISDSVEKSMALIHYMSKTIDDFRDYFRPDKDKTEFGLSEVLASTLLLVGDSFKHQQVVIEVITEQTPVILGYRNEFAQSLLNILNNARDALTERSIENPRVKVTLSSAGGRAVITVADNAGGIPKEIIDKIFDPYFTTKGPQAGTGLGLFMSKAIIEKNLGGRLTVRNTGDGAEFRIEV